MTRKKTASKSKKYPRHIVAIPDWTYNEIKKIAEKEDITGGMKVRQILARYLAEKEKTK